jgi:hypothetical protein
MSDDREVGCWGSRLDEEKVDSMSLGLRSSKSAVIT